MPPRQAPRQAAPRSKAPKDLLFTLIPEDDEARLVVLSNPDHATSNQGVSCLACYADRSSKIEGRLLSFGRHAANDIRLPSGPAGNSNSAVVNGARSGRSYQNYRNEHFFLFLAPSGELILRDLSPCLTAIEIEHAKDDEARLYALHGKDPRQRVIPRTSRSVFIVFGTSTVFRLKWARGYHGEVDIADFAVQGKLAAQALAHHMRGMTLTAPDQDTFLQPPLHHSRELRSRYTPSGGSSMSGYTRPIHKYGVLGKGSFGQVSKAVELTSGDLWAVKEIRGASGDDRWKLCFLREVEILKELSHENIVHFETYQDFCIGGSFQLFFRLYKGSVFSLIHHSCDSPQRPAPPDWWAKFVTQMSCALEYLHSKGVVHRDIKPENIMYDHTYGSDNLSFFLGDFGLSMTQAVIQNKRPGGGTDFYNAPEIAATGAPTPASDIWALGVTFGQVLGYWCGGEMSRSGDFWNRKLAAFGCPSANYRDPPHLKYKDLMWTHRVLTFARQAIIPITLARMMSGAVAERPSAAELCRTPLAWLTDVPHESAAMRAATRAAAGIVAGPAFGQQLRPSPNTYGQPQPQPRQPAGPPLAPLRPSNNNNYIYAAPHQRPQSGVANSTPRMAGEDKASDWATTSTGLTGTSRAMPGQEPVRGQGRRVR